MKLIGNLKGMSFYPKMLKTTTPTKHKYGADLTVSLHTDTYKPTLVGHGWDFEINAFKNNLQGTILISPSTDRIYEKEIKEVLKTGRISSGIYFRAFLEEIQEQVDFHKEVTGKYGSYWSYGNGERDHDEFVLNNSLLTRASGDGETSYDFDVRLSKRVSTVFNYSVRDNGMEWAMDRARSMINQTIVESGWYNDFTHWHWAETVGEKNQLEPFLSMLASELTDTNYVSLGSGEAVEYMWLRKQYLRGGIYQDGNELVLLSDVRNEDKLPYKVINNELSVEVDVSGTILENKELTSSQDILKVDNNKFIVQVPYDMKDGFSVVRLKETNEPKYLDFKKPTILSVELNDNRINVETDKLTRAVLFGVPSGGELYQAKVLARSNDMNHTHELAVSTKDLDFYVGVITKEGQSILSDKY